MCAQYSPGPRSHATRVAWWRHSELGCRRRSCITPHQWVNELLSIWGASTHSQDVGKHSANVCERNGETQQHGERWNNVDLVHRPTLDT